MGNVPRSINHGINDHKYRDQTRAVNRDAMHDYRAPSTDSQ